jgi:3-deoxy-manno-octulosonate cytidylyltransferase (CMP-KDO synthetase)
VIPFRRSALLSFAGLPRGLLEDLESIDMLRFLENGLPVHVVPTDVETHAVDVPEDIEVVSQLMARRPWPRAVYGAGE